MDNCFTYTYRMLKKAEFKVPKAWDRYTDKDMRKFIVEYETFLSNKVHYAFFESFCEYVEDAVLNDIIIDDNGIGIAVNRYKYMTIAENSGKVTMDNITRDKKILRVKHG